MVGLSEAMAVAERIEATLIAIGLSRGELPPVPLLRELATARRQIVGKERLRAYALGLTTFLFVLGTLVLGTQIARILAIIPWSS
jgi:hypothetical protein